MGSPSVFAYGSPHMIIMIMIIMIIVIIIMIMILVNKDCSRSRNKSPGHLANLQIASGNQTCMALENPRTE